MLYRILYNNLTFINHLRNIQLLEGSLGRFVSALLIVGFLQAPHPLQHQAIVKDPSNGRATKGTVSLRDLSRFFGLFPLNCYS